MNLLKDTLNIMTANDISPEEIVFIGSLESGHCCTWEEFQELADREYDDGYGAQWVATDLTIVFSSGSRLIRGTADGSEWWEWLSPPKVPTSTQRLNYLFSIHGWETLRSINEG